MSLLVVGSVALDTIETPRGRADDALGGSATHFALAAALLARVRLMGFIGEDFPAEHVDLLRKRGIDLTGLETKPGKTFRWHGRYSEDMNVRKTISIALNVFGEYEPVAPPSYLDSEFVFLANGSPVHQLRIVDQMPNARFTVVDTMDHWIKGSRAALMELLKRVQAVFVNDEEARLLTGLRGIAAARAILDLGPPYVVVKKGDHGAVMATADDVFLIPAFPVTDVRDPTGAGDSFAGGVMGYLAEAGEPTPAVMRRALAYGSVIASFSVEDFGVRRTAVLTRPEVEERLAEFRAMLAF